jgi:hypothetical protein
VAHACNSKIWEAEDQEIKESLSCHTLSKKKRKERKNEGKKGEKEEGREGGRKEERKEGRKEGRREGRQDKKINRVPGAHACNPSYSGGRDQEHHCSKPAWANSSQDPISKNKKTENLTKRLVVWLKV